MYIKLYRKCVFCVTVSANYLIFTRLTRNIKNQRYTFIP